MKSLRHSFRLKTISLLWFFLALFFNDATAQCDGDITLYGQSSVNYFKQSYGCTVVSGHLNVYGEDITNLDSLNEVTEVGALTIGQTVMNDLTDLASLTTVHGKLNIRFNTALTSLAGLENIEKVGSLDIENNTTLPNLMGLSRLRTIEGRMWVSRNARLLSLNGLELLDSIRADLTVENNDMLQALTGLDNLQTVGSVRLGHNISLYSLAGLESLASVREGVVIFLNLALEEIGQLQSLENVGKRFWVSFNPEIRSLEGLKIKTVTATVDPLSFDEGIYISDTKIRDLKGLENLQHVVGRIYIGYNDSLKTLDGLDNLQSLNGHLGIESNVNLESINAIADLPMWTGELELNDNDSLLICSVPSICRYLEAPVGLLLIWGNKPGCQSPEEILANCSPVVEFNLIDANLEVDDSPTTKGDIRDLLPADLIPLDKMRAGVATDGISTVLVRLVTGYTGQMTIPNAAEEGIEFPWGETTHLINGKNYLFFLYTPPDEFDEFQDVFMYGDGVEAYNLDFDFEFTHEQQVRTNFLTITHVRPPVVLMHGTYSDPDQAWKTAATEGTSMFDRLVDEGFKVFTVNYKETNGTTGWITDNTSFADNAKVLWGDVYPQNTGGIKDALTHYRETLGIAVTQADVIGHSLGGILPRVYASENFNPDYKRPENFMEGDINRLITLGSTHFGSHLGELQVFLNGLSVLDIGALDWLATQAYNLVSSWLGASASNAVADQMPPPMGTALGEIGRTEIPSHALTLSVPSGALKDSVYDPDESYYDMYWYITTLLYQVHDVRNEYLDTKLALAESDLQAETTITGELPADLYPEYNKYMLYKGMIEDAIQYAGTITSILDGEFELPTDVEIYKYALAEAGMSDFGDPLIDIFISGADPVGVALDYFSPIQFPTVSSIIEDQLKVNQASMEGLRSLIFNNDANDGVVRVQSQSGELEKECPQCVSHFDNTLHGFASRYPMVQDRIVDLLTGGMLFFNESGFPPVDHAQKIYYPPEELSVFQVPVNGGPAICQSGIPPSQARAIAHVADENNVIIIMRPVNPDATELIINNAATKAMNVKPKTSNWGPQKGYLPVKQRYSKLWKIFEGSERLKKIHEYDSLAQSDLNSGVALARELTVANCSELYKVFIDENKITGPDDANAEDEVMLVPVADPSQVCRWGGLYASNEIIEDCEPISDEHQLVPMIVMASPDEAEDDGSTPRYLTADYDLLMIGFYEGPDQEAPDPPILENRPVVGQATPEQEVLFAKINNAVQQTGYRGGKVVHHGPENQYDDSPYIDYPLTVFAPDHIPNGFFNRPTDGLILSIGSGRPGFRDEHLKRFVNRMRKEGYDLYHNRVAPGWRWTWDEQEEGYLPEDSRDLKVYIEQLPKNDCDKYGGKKKPSCPTALNPNEDTNDEPGTPPAKPNLNGEDVIRFSVTPTIVYDEPITFTIELEKAESFSWMIIDPLGNIRDRGQISGNQNHINLSVDVSKLGAGMYTVVTDIYGQVGRIIKM